MLSTPVALTESENRQNLLQGSCDHFSLVHVVVTELKIIASIYLAHSISSLEKKERRTQTELLAKISFPHGIWRILIGMKWKQLLLHMYPNV